jgi:hypothetical protein
MSLDYMSRWVGSYLTWYNRIGLVHVSEDHMESCWVGLCSCMSLE